MELESTGKQAVYIEWRDTVSDGYLWMDMDSAIAWADESDEVIKQVGFIIKETNKFIVLASSVNPQSHCTKVSGLIKIPKSSIVKRKQI